MFLGLIFQISVSSQNSKEISLALPFYRLELEIVIGVHKNFLILSDIS
jgi:hypothetical protein